MADLKVLFVPCAGRTTAKRKAPWAKVLIQDKGGFWCYSSEYEYLKHDRKLVIRRRKTNV